MIKTEEAFNRLVTIAKPLTTERIAVRHCHMRTLAAPIIARRSQPATALSAMDGYAVKSEDLKPDQPVGLTLLNRASKAGTPFDLPLSSGQAVRIFTGATLPQGADQVIMQEDVTVNQGQIAVLQTPNPGHFIRQEAKDFEERETLLDAGTVLTPKSLGLIAAAGHGWLMVHRRPRLVIIVTGDEIVAPDHPDALKSHQTVDSASPMISALVEDAGAIIVDILYIKDNLDDLKAGLKLAQAKKADVTVTLGGASVGDHDHLGEALDQVGAKRNFWKIAMRPGKPLLTALYGDTIIVGLPGNPVSAFVCSFLFLRPLIDKLMGRPAPFPRGVPVPCAVDMAAEGPRDHYHRARLIMTDNGPLVDPALDQDSSLTSVLAGCDGLIIRKANAQPLIKGELCHYLPF